MTTTSLASAAPLRDPELAHDFADVAVRMSAYYFTVGEGEPGADRMADVWATVALNVGRAVERWDREQERLAQAEKVRAKAEAITDFRRRAAKAKAAKAKAAKAKRHRH